MMARNIHVLFLVVALAAMVSLAAGVEVENEGETYAIVEDYGTEPEAAEDEGELYR